MGKRTSEVHLVIVLLHTDVVDENKLRHKSAPAEFRVRIQIWDVADYKMVAVEPECITLV